MLPKTQKNVLAVEAGATLGWYKYLNGTGRVIGVDKFGTSAKSKDIYAHEGITVENIVNTFIQMMKDNA